MDKNERSQMRVLADELDYHPDPVVEGIRGALEDVGNMLLTKNHAYGNSALDPIRIFSKADAKEQIRVRIDDKLSRLMRGGGTEDEDVLMDLMGYLVLLRVAEKTWT